MPRVTITVPDKTPQPYRFQLDRQSVSLGRGSENDIAIDSGSISVKHAQMRRVEGGYELRDLGSTNGIKLDGERREVIPLRSGMSLKVGDVTFDFQLTEEELETLHKEKPMEDVAEADDDAIELPSKPAPRRAAATVPPAGGGGGFGMILLFIILAAAAFFAGLAVRFQKDTGGSFLDAIKSKGAITTPALPAGDPAAEEAPTEGK
jgi:pSer/pThr/pTyr-binding forkhead associated (FHA) protein